MILLVGMVGRAQTGTAGKHAAVRVEEVFIGKDQRVHLRWTGQPERLAPRDRGGYCENDPKCEEAGVGQLAVSENRRSVGWVAEYNGCCQNYPVPWVLVIAREGRVVHQLQGGRPISEWQFEKGDERIAMLTDTSHGNMFPECVLYDTRSWKIVAEWHRGKSRVLPAWAKSFAEDVGPVEEATNP